MISLVLKFLLSAIDLKSRAYSSRKLTGTSTMREFVVPSIFFDKAKGPDTAKIAAALPEIEKCVKVLDDALAATGYLVGDKMTYADMNVLPMLAAGCMFPQGKEIVERFPNVSAFVAKLTDLPSFKNTAPPKS